VDEAENKHHWDGADRDRHESISQDFGHRAPS
jgi:hypothetical protein